MSEKLRKIKDKATKLYGKGKYDKALLLYRQVVKADPRDLSARLRMGDLYRRTDQPSKAIEVYRQVADFYARDGLLLKAIAACKLILEVDAQHSDTQTLLADLYSQKYGRPAASAPPAPTEPVAVPVASSGSGVELATGTPDYSDELPAELQIQHTGAIDLPADDGAPLELTGTGDEIEIDIDTFDEDVEVDVTTLEPPPMTLAPRPKELPTIPLFSDLPREAFISLMTRMTLRRLDPGDVVIRQGEQGESFFVLASGKLRVFRETTGGEIELAHLGEGQFFGEMALLSDAPRSASVAALDECEVFELSGELLDALTDQFGHVEEALQRFYRQRLLSNLLATSPVFRPFDKDDRKDLIQKFTALEVPAGETVVEEGQTSGGLFLIMTGELAVTKGSGFEEVTLARLGEGDIFGEMSLISHDRAGASVRAIRNCTLLRLSQQGFQELMMTHPQILEVVGNLTEARNQANARVLAQAAAGLDIDDDELPMI